MAGNEYSPPAIVLVINGPNLNLLGIREPGLYGQDTLSAIEAQAAERASVHSIQPEFHQSNHEGDLVDLIQSARGKAKGIILNPGAYTHTSVAIRDAISAVGVPTVEVHITNVHAREDFRHKSFVSPVALAVIAGAGLHGYLFALDLLAARFVQTTADDRVATA